MNKKYSYALLHEKVTVIRFSGIPLKSDILTAIDEISQHEKTGQRIWDLSRGFNLTTAEIKDIVDYSKDKWPQTQKVAFIAPDDLSFGNLRMYASLMRSYEKFMVFRSADKALDWCLADD